MKRVNYVSSDGEILFYRNYVSKEELSARLLTDYIVVNDKVYENVGSDIRGNDYQIQIEEVEGEQPYGDNNVKWNYKRLEYREYKDEPKQRKIINEFNIETSREFLPLLLLFKPTINNKIYKRCASEIDDDREVYVVYYIDECNC